MTYALTTAALAIAFAATPILVAARAGESPTAYTCAFKDGTSGSYAEGAFKSAKPEALSFTIENIDLEKQTASIKTTDSTTDGKLSVVRAINANHFIEAVNEGFLNITTIYDKDAGTGFYPAVHSRHFGILGQPVFGQYNGTCTAAP